MQAKREQLTPDLARRIVLDAHEFAAYKGAFSGYSDAEIISLIRARELLAASVAMRLEQAPASPQPPANPE